MATGGAEASTNGLTCQPMVVEFRLQTTEEIVLGILQEPDAEKDGRLVIDVNATYRQQVAPSQQSPAVSTAASNLLELHVAEHWGANTNGHGHGQLRSENTQLIGGTGSTERHDGVGAG